MKLDKVGKKTAIKAVAGCVLALSTSLTYCGTMGPATNPSNKVYVGAFGGGALISRMGVTQSGTAFFLEANGGPLAVNAFGSTNSDSTGILGGHIGFAWPNAVGARLPLTPAVELEGYCIGRTALHARDLSNQTERLPEHDFFVTYPLKTGVFLVNAVVSADDSLGRASPYVGIGIGSAVLSVSGAISTQVNPSEIGVNHYNSETNDRAVAFAAQPKAGVSFDFGRTSIFVEYRFLYLSQTNYTFGSTVYPTHVATSPWLVKIKPQHYNMATIGVDFDL